LKRKKLAGKGPGLIEIKRDPAQLSDGIPGSLMADLKGLGGVIIPDRLIVEFL
jgi:hypothetical protein